MGWGQDEVERQAATLLGAAGVSARERSMVAVAEGLGIEVRPMPESAARHDAALCRVGEAWRLYVRRTAPTDWQRFCVAHELAEWWLQQSGYCGQCAEALADRLGAAILVPRPRMAAVARRGLQLLELARVLRAPESLVALRVAEVVGTPTALVSPGGVRVRGDTWPWPDPEALRRLASPQAHAPDGVRRIRLRPGLERVALVAA